MLTLSINGRKTEVDTSEDTPLLWVLRDELDLTGTKYGCGMGLCGACTVHVDGSAVRSCSLPVGQVTGKEVTTIEGLATPAGRAVQAAWIDEEVVQCGYCQSGQIMQASALLSRNSLPDEKAIENGMSGVVCRCGTYQRIRRAVQRAAQRLEENQDA